MPRTKNQNRTRKIRSLRKSIEEVNNVLSAITTLLDMHKVDSSDQELKRIRDKFRLTQAKIKRMKDSTLSNTELAAFSEAIINLEYATVQIFSELLGRIKKARKVERAKQKLEKE